MMNIPDVFMVNLSTADAAYRKAKDDIIIAIQQSRDRLLHNGYTEIYWIQPETNRKMVGFVPPGWMLPPVVSGMNDALRKTKVFQFTTKELKAKLKWGWNDAHISVDAWLKSLPHGTFYSYDLKKGYPTET